MTTELLSADTVEFVLIEKTSCVVTKNDVKTEPVDATLDSVYCYREGEQVSQYDQGDQIDSLDADVVREAATVAGIALFEDGGNLIVPS